MQPLHRHTFFNIKKSNSGSCVNNYSSHFAIQSGNSHWQLTTGIQTARHHYTELPFFTKAGDWLSSKFNTVKIYNRLVPNLRHIFKTWVITYWKLLQIKCLSIYHGILKMKCRKKLRRTFSLYFRRCLSTVVYSYYTCASTAWFIQLFHVFIQPRCKVTNFSWKAPELTEALLRATVSTLKGSNPDSKIDFPYLYILHSCPFHQLVDIFDPSLAQKFEREMFSFGKHLGISG